VIFVVHSQFSLKDNHSVILLFYTPFATWIERHIDHDKTIIILQNREGSTMPIRNIRAILYNKPKSPPVERKEIQLPKETLARYVGEYEIELGFVIKIFMEGNELKARATDQDPNTIFAETETNFFYKGVEAQIEFVMNKENKVNKIILHQNGNQIEGIRIK
jgi:hypothetical protein